MDNGKSSRKCCHGFFEADASLRQRSAFGTNEA